MTDKGELSASKRNREFKKHVDKIDAQIRHASSIFSFESICVTMGSVVNQDHNLTRMVASDASIDFFFDRFCSSDSIVLGQMKTHVYDCLSRKIAADDDKTPENGLDAAPTMKEEPTVGTLPGETPVPSINVLKNRLIGLAARHRITITKGSSLIWKGLPQAVATAGCVFVNWPEDVPFPCNDAGKSNSKGISILKLPACILLLAALDHPTHPLTLEKKYDSAVPEDKPVIIGIPPDANSAHTHSRCKFLGPHCNEDRKGPPQLKAPSASNRNLAAAIQKPTSHTSKKEAIFIDADPDEDKDEDNGHCAQPPASKGKATSKGKNQDGSPKYSGSDDDIPMACSPHLLRGKEKARGKSKASTKCPAKKCLCPSADEDEDKQYNSEASVTEINVDSMDNSPKSNKKRHIQPSALKPLLPTKAAVSTPMQSRARSATTKVAEMLFRDDSTGPKQTDVRASPASHSVTPLPVPATAAPCSKTSAQPDLPQPPASLPSAPASGGNQPLPIFPQAYFPQQKAGDHLQGLGPPVPQQEGFYPANYPPPFGDLYNARYAHPEGPPSWNPAPAQGPPGWYAPENVHPPSSSNLQQAGYWGHPVYANPYTCYLPPNAHQTYPPQDNASRAGGNGQGGPST